MQECDIESERYIIPDLVSFVRSIKIEKCEVS